MSDRLFWRGGGGLLVLVSPALAAGLAGCQPQASCPQGGAACGGNLEGTWNVVDACRDPVYAPPEPTTYQGQPVQTARQANPVLASSDWCSSLFVSGATTVFTFPHDTLGVSGGQITYQADGTYHAAVDTRGPGSIDLSPACLTRSGMSLGCDAAAAALTQVAANAVANPQVPCSDVPSEPSKCQYYFSYEDITCASDGNDGCACRYTVSFAGIFTGRWSAVGGVLTHFDAAKMLPTQADFCVEEGADRLSLWGHDRSSLFDMPGLLTLELQRAP